MFGSWGQIVLMFGTSCNTKTNVSVLSGCYEDSVTKHTKIQDSAPCPALSDLCGQSIRQEGVEVRVPLRTHDGHTWVLGSKQNGWYLFPQQLILLSLLKDVEMDSERGTTLGRVKAEVNGSYGRGRKQEFLVESLQDSLWDMMDAVPCTNISPHCTDCLFTLDYFPDPWRSCSDIFCLSNPTWTFGCLSKGQYLVSCLHSCLLFSPNRFELSTGAGWTQQGVHKWRQRLFLSQSLSATSIAGRGKTHEPFLIHAILGISATRSYI